MAKPLSAAFLAQIIAKCAIPFVWAPSGTMANNGAITLGTALPAIYANCFLNLPASAIQAGSAAGWYYAQMSSTTVGTVFNNTYSSGQPAIPAAATPFVSTGPGAYTGVTGAVLGPNWTLPADTLGRDGALRYSFLWLFPGNTNTKTIQGMLGSSAVFSSAQAAAANVAFRSEVLVHNQGVQNSQVSNSGGQFGSASPAGDTYFSVDTTSAQTIGARGNLAVATDYIILDALLIEAMP